MRLCLVCAFLLTCLVSPALPETITCANTNVSVSALDSTYAEMTCDAVGQAQVLFDNCGMPPVTNPIRIEIVSALKSGCVALYHCNEDWIEVLAPPVMEARRSPESAFAFLAIEPYFRSVIVHELSHAIFDDVPCPFEACIAANEYVAYGLQVMSLTPEQQTDFSRNSNLDRRISRDELNPITLFMAPSLFAQKSWAHLSQRGDPCAYIGQILDGSILLDYERF